MLTPIGFIDQRSRHVECISLKITSRETPILTQFLNALVCSNPTLNIVRSEIMVLSERLQMKKIQEASGEYLKKLTL